MLVAGLAAMATAATLAAVATVGVAYAATACQVTYSVTNSWQNGFQGAIGVTNVGDPWNGWTLRFAFTGGQVVSQGWGARWQPQSGANVTVTNESWNASVPTNTSFSLGFIASTKLVSMKVAKSGRRLICFSASMWSA